MRSVYISTVDLTLGEIYSTSASICALYMPKNKVNVKSQYIIVAVWSNIDKVAYHNILEKLLVGLCRIMFYLTCLLVHKAVCASYKPSKNN